MISLDFNASGKVQLFPVLFFFKKVLYNKMPWDFSCKTWTMEIQSNCYNYYSWNNREFFSHVYNSLGLGYLGLSAF